MHLSAGWDAFCLTNRVGLNPPTKCYTARLPIVPLLSTQSLSRWISLELLKPEKEFQVSGWPLYLHTIEKLQRLAERPTNLRDERICRICNTHTHTQASLDGDNLTCR